MGTAGKLFVQAYNVSQVVGWSWILAKVLLQLSTGDFAVFGAVECPVIVFQVLLLFDVTHRKVINPLLGLAHGSAAAALPQTVARIWNAVFIQALVPKYS